MATVLRDASWCGMTIPAPATIEKTGDDSPAASLWAYIWRMTGRRQIVAALLALSVALTNLAPVELQRRVIDDAITPQNMDALWLLGGIYLAVVILHQLLKFALRLWQGWMAESAILYTRLHLLRLYGESAMTRPDDSGTMVSMVSQEIDKLGGFVGDGPSQALTNIVILLGAMGYMLYVSPQIALAGLAFLIPQVVLTPLMQRRLNALVAQRVRYMRRLSNDVPRLADARSHVELQVLPRLYRNRMWFFFVKFLLKGLLNLLNHAGPLTVLVFGGYLAIQGETSVGVLVAFLAGFERVSSPLRELISIYRQAEQARVQHQMIARTVRDELIPA